jgi:hypothetical protein
MEAYSRTYVRALGAAAGVAADVPEYDLNSRDCHFWSRDGDDDAGAELHAQLKSTVDGLTPIQGGKELSFRLDHDDYDHLRKVVFVPRLLVVVQIPKDPSRWIECRPDDLLLRAAAWWVNLRGYPASASGGKVTVHIPVVQRFHLDALLGNMRSVAER